MRLLLLALLGLLLTACGDPPPPAPPPRPAPAVEPLALVLRVPQGEYGAGEAMVFEVEATNRGTEPLTLAHFDDEMWWYAVRFESLDGGPHFTGGNLELIDYETSPDVVLAPGAVWRKELRLTEYGRFLRIIENRMPGDDWDYREELPPGRYRATLSYENASEGGRGYWVGTVRSDPVEITVAPAR